jgi:hypothetical protein
MLTFFETIEVHQKQSFIETKIKTFLGYNGPLTFKMSQGKKNVHPDLDTYSTPW